MQTITAESFVGKSAVEIAVLLEAARKQAVDAAKPEPKKLSMKVSEKGGLSVYGLGRFPVTLYMGQWIRLIEHIETLKAFMVANADKLKVKE